MNNKYAKSPAKGLSAEAAYAAVLILVIPLENSVAEHTVIIKNIARLEINIPVQISNLISLISFFVDMVVICFNSFSSISCDVCQKNKYGDIVVPNIPQINNICPFVNSI